MLFSAKLLESKFAQNKIPNNKKEPATADAEAKRFVPNPNHAQAYVYRNESFGGAVSMPVTVDGKLAGNTGPKSYFKFNLPEGKHVIASQGDKSTLNIETEKTRIITSGRKSKWEHFPAALNYRLSMR